MNGTRPGRKSVVAARSTSHLDDTTGEDRYRLEPVDAMDPEKLFERRWAMTVLEQAQGKLAEEYAKAGKAELYTRLRAAESGDKGLQPSLKLLWHWDLAKAP